MLPECIKERMWTMILLVASNIFMTFACYAPIHERIIVNFDGLLIVPDSSRSQGLTKQ